MNARTKAGVDWVEIKQRIQAGESGRAISLDLKSRGQEISGTAINARVKRKGWRQGDNTAVTLDEIKRNPPGLQRADGKRTSENLERIIQDLADGCSLHVASERAGMHYETLRLWRKEDEDVDRLVLRACAERDARRENRIETAGAADWKAAEALLKYQRKEVYAPAAQNAPSISVTINIPAPKQPESIIDVTPRAVEEASEL